MFVRSRRHIGSHVIFDIGDIEVGVGIAVCDEEGCHVLWQHRTRYVYDVADEYVRYERAMLAALLDAGMSLVSDGVRTAGMNTSFDFVHTRATCIVSAPWFRGAVKQIVRHSEPGATATHSLLDEMRSASYATFINDVDVRNWCSVMGDPEPLEQLDVQMRLDGYDVVAYEDSRFHDIELHVYHAIIAERVAHNMRDILQRTLPNHEHRIVTATPLLLRSIHTACEHVRTQGCIIELGGRVSTVSLIRGGHFFATAPFSFGSDHVLQAVAPRATSALEAQSAYQLMTQNFHEHEYAALPEVLRTALASWHEALVHTSTGIADGIVVPQQSMLIAGAAWRPAYSAVLTQPFLQPGVRKMAGFNTCQCLVPSKASGIGSAHDERLELLAASVDEAASIPRAFGSILGV